jgi:enoyl-CoA hydratase/carnithine racemase
VERKGPVATIWIDRQPKMNTMTVAMRNEFPGIFQVLDGDETVRVIVVRGAGGKAFSAGGDVAEFLTLAPADLELWGDTLTSAERCRKPVIAAIDGYTMGAGLELAVACDFRVATLRSEFAFPEVRLGMIPGSGGTQRLVRLIGLARAKDVVMRGRRIGAEEALALGLVTRLADDPHAAALDLAREIASKSPIAVQKIKRAMNAIEGLPVRDGYRYEQGVTIDLSHTEDAREAQRAFVEKRKPIFKGK